MGWRPCKARYVRASSIIIVGVQEQDASRVIWYRKKHAGSTAGVPAISLVLIQRVCTTHTFLGRYESSHLNVSKTSL